MGMDKLGVITSFVHNIVVYNIPLLYGTVGEIMVEKSGSLNLGVEGMMLLGAVSGFAVAMATGNTIIAILVAGLAGMLGALIYAVISITLRGNHTVTGLALTIFGTGLSGFMGKPLAGLTLPAQITSDLAAVKIPILSDIPIIGPALFNQSPYILLAIGLAIALHFFYNKTRLGLHVRCVGENPAAADASGLNVPVIKYVNVLLGGFLCGIGGAYLSLCFLATWQENLTAGIGWIAVALIISSTWRPLRAIGGAYFFGFLQALGYKIQNRVFTLFGLSFSVPYQFLSMLPYLITVIALAIISIRKRPENQPPAGLGVSYFREER